MARRQCELINGSSAVGRSLAIPSNAMAERIKAGSGGHPVPTTTKSKAAASTIWQQPHCAASPLQCSNAFTFILNQLVANVPIKTITSREFNHAASEAKRAANEATVFITDRGRPAHVLMSISEYQRLTQQRRSIADALSMPVLDDADFAAEPVRIAIRPADLS